jgi:hypothetical protein
MLVDIGCIGGIIELQVKKYPFMDIATEDESGPTERKSLIFSDAPVALLAVEIRIGFQQTVVSELRVASQADFIIPFATGVYFG